MVDVDNKMYMVMILKDIYLLVQLSDAIIGYMLNSIDGRTLNWTIIRNSWINNMNGVLDNDINSYNIHAIYGCTFLTTVFHHNLLV